MKRITVLGSTGSIGVQTLDVARRFTDRVEIVGLTAGSNAEMLIEQALEFRPRAVALADARGLAAVRGALEPAGIAVFSGEAGVAEIAADDSVDTVVAAISGFAGLRPTLAASSTGADLALANKEAVVCAGSLLLNALRDSGGSLIPVDSEHSALFQCLLGEVDPASALILTASGGPFLDRDPDSLRSVSPEEALAHPRWDMGPKISIDSATMMNKGLEIIEARWLFDVPFEAIEVVIHPESIVHSLVRFRDGSLKAHLGPTDMRYAIMYALGHPDRWADPGFRAFELADTQLNFHRPDPSLFPALALARAAGEAGGLMPTVLVSSDEIAVRAFLDGRIAFTQIAEVIESTLEHASSRSMGGETSPSVEAVFEANDWARRRAEDFVATMRRDDGD